ncbi:hypothetical protein VPHF86_0079 [Vibrio phage F86]
MMITIYLLIGAILTALTGKVVRKRYLDEVVVRDREPIPVEFFVVTCILVLPLCGAVLIGKRVLEFLRIL